MKLRCLQVDLNSGAATRHAWEGGSAPGPVAYAVHHPDPDAIMFGVGPLGDLRVPGANRLVFAGYSELWEGFFTSTLGSAGAALRHLGVEMVTLIGSAPAPSALILGANAVRIEPLDVDAAWAIHSDQPRGVYGLIEAVRAAGWTHADSPRVLAVGPAARTTRLGAIVSSVAHVSEPVTLDTWAGRGGFGSRLLQKHNIAAIVLDAPADAGRTALATDRTRSLAIADATKKYRYHPMLKTGGTLGTNLATLQEKLLAFNDRSMYWPVERRRGVHETLIEGRYLRQFNEQTSNGRGQDCGETCPAVCKKVATTSGGNGLTKDFQPYAALGPHIGVFDQRAAEHAADTADLLGFDAVEAGALCAWAADCVADDLLEPSDVGFPGRPAWDLETFDAEADSHHNAHLAAHLLAQVALSDDPSPLISAMRRGIRAAAQQVGGAAAQRASYSAHGDSGSIAPNHYWTPGIVAPVPVPGKYYTDYSLEFCGPRELGRRSGIRLTAELALDNLGMCRFQREWAEERLPTLLSEAGGGHDVWPAHRELARRIFEMNTPRFWETGRTIDRVRTYLTEALLDDDGNETLAQWVDRFEADPVNAARDYWNEFRAGLTSEVNAS